MGSQPHMNWKYVLIGFLRRYVPQRVLFAVMERRGDGSVEEKAPGDCLEMWLDRLSKHNLHLAGKHILEIGSGRYARLGLQMLAAGAQSITLIDPYAVSLTEPVHRTMLQKDCSGLGLNCEDAFSRIHIVKGDITRLSSPLPDRKMDLAITHSVLEHVRDPKAVLTCCWKWLKPGGITEHIIDLRDHNLRFRYPYEMLTFSDHVWSHWLDLRDGFHLNRWRVPDYLRAAHVADFVNIDYEILLKDEAALKAILPRLHCRFRSVPEELLSILSISLYCQKPLDVESE